MKGDDLVSKPVHYNDYYLQNNITYEKGYYNIVRTPCGSGKTFHCLEFITEPEKFQNRYGKDRDVRKCLYVTDTCALRESVVKDYEMKTGKHVSTEENYSKNLRVITYAKLANELIKYRNNEPAYISNYDYIFLDEIHQLFEYSNRFDAKTRSEEPERAAYQDVIDLLPTMCENTTLICLSATPDSLFKHLEEMDDEWKLVRDLVPLTELHKIKCYTTRYSIPVWDIQSTIENLNLEDGDKLFIFGITIRELLAFEQICIDKGYTTTSLWSIAYNMNAERGKDVDEKYIMNDHQLEARDKLLSTGEYDSQVLILNGAYESGINIENAYDSEKGTIFVIAATSNDVQITQARGRIRHDIDTLYYLTSSFSYEDEIGRENNRALCERCDILVQECEKDDKLFVGKSGLLKLAGIINVWKQRKNGTRHLCTSVKSINDFMLLKSLPYQVDKITINKRISGKKKKITCYVLVNTDDF